MTYNSTKVPSRPKITIEHYYDYDYDCDCDYYYYYYYYYYYIAST